MHLRLPWWALIAPALLIALYGLLIFAALGNQANFYGPMNMPLPNHGFMHISWTGKTAAIWLMLVIAVVTRMPGMVLLALVGVVVQQIGDFIAGARTDVDVFITQIGFALWCVSVAVILFSLFEASRKSTVGEST